MTERIDALMARYAGGQLPLPAHVLVASHLELSSANRAMVRGLETMGGEALESSAPIDLENSANRLEAILASKEPPAPKASRDNGDGLFPRVLRDFVGFDASSVPWKRRLPGYKEFDLGEIDGCHVNLFWIKPGRPIPEHTHEGLELSLVLDGAFNDVTGRYARGDIAVNDESVDHRPIAEKTVPCIGMAVTDGPLRFTGSLTRRLGDLFFV